MFSSCGDKDRLQRPCYPERDQLGLEWMHFKEEISPIQGILTLVGEIRGKNRSIGFVFEKMKK